MVEANAVYATSADTAVHWRVATSDAHNNSDVQRAQLESSITDETGLAGVRDWRKSFVLSRGCFTLGRAQSVARQSLAAAKNNEVVEKSVLVKNNEVV